MKSTTSLLAGMAAALCLAGVGLSRGDNVSNQIDPTKHHHYANPDGKAVWLNADKVIPGHYSYDYVVTGPTPALYAWAPTPAETMLPVAVGAPPTYGGESTTTTTTTEAAPAPAPPLPPPSATTPPNFTQVPAPVNRASHVLGMTVKNPQGQTLGKIKDIVFDLPSGRIVYVVMAKSHVAHGTGPNVAVPIDQLTPSADRQHLILNATEDQLQGASGFSSNNLPAMNNPAFGAQPSAQAGEPVQREILIVPVPVTPSQDQGLSPDQGDNIAPDTDQGPDGP